MIYVLTFLITATTAGLLVQANAKVATIVIALILATFAALRGADVAADFAVYESWYFDPSDGDGLLERPGLFEAIYFQLSNIFMQSGMPFRAFVWVLVFIAVALKMWIIFSFSKSAQAFVAGLFVYIFSFYLLHDFTQIRAGMAVAVLFFAFRQLIDGHRWHFVLLVLMATGFHSSALIAFLLLLSYRGRLGRSLHVGLLVATFSLILLAANGISAGAILVQALLPFDPRLELHLSVIEDAELVTANPFPVMGLFALVLVLSLTRICLNLSEPGRLYQTRESYAVLLICRSILIGLCFLESLWVFQTVALRLYELNMSLIPILASIVFSKREWILQKVLLLLWTVGAAYLFIFRNEGLVLPYVWLFS